jgi:hypothetical protein
VKDEVSRRVCAAAPGRAPHYSGSARVASVKNDNGGFLPKAATFVGSVNLAQNEICAGTKEQQKKQQKNNERYLA